VTGAADERSKTVDGVAGIARESEWLEPYSEVNYLQSAVCNSKFLDSQLSAQEDVISNHLL
jgi:hypothetical protein